MRRNTHGDVLLLYVQVYDAEDINTYSHTLVNIGSNLCKREMSIALVMITDLTARRGPSSSALAGGGRA